MKNNLRISLSTLFFIISSFLILCTCVRGQIKEYTVEELKENFSVEDIYKELIIRHEAHEEKRILEDIEHIRGLEPFHSDTLDKSLEGQYGEDNRQNYYEVNDKLKENAEKVACLINKDNLDSNPDGTYTIKPYAIFGEKNKLCTDERYYDEPVVGKCSGFAISEDYIVTAGHCIHEYDYNDYYFVFGYYVTAENKVNLTVKAEDVFEIKSIICREHDIYSKIDYAVVQVNKEIPPGRIAEIRDTGKVSDSAEIYIIGYPSGLPLKIADDANIFGNYYNNYFITNLDAFHGNSGSPVFNSRSHFVEGILFEGGKDFIYINNCYTLFKCPQNIDICVGEKVLRISLIPNMTNK